MLSEYDARYKKLVAAYESRRYHDVVQAAQWFYAKHPLERNYSVSLFTMAAYIHLAQFGTALAIGQTLFVQYESGNLPPQHHFALLFNLAFVVSKFGKKERYLDLMQKAKDVVVGEQVKKAEEHLKKFFQL